jgi:adenine-specific DNA-methyltransferase
VNTVLNNQKSFLATKPLTERKTLGQYFTSDVIAAYMASLINLEHLHSVRILDAGAGSGILSAATAIECLAQGVRQVHLVAYEIDPQVIPYLESTLSHVQDEFDKQASTFTYEIVCEDFVLHRPDKRYQKDQFDTAVINPPYFKYSVSESPYAKAVSDLYRGDPNVYASFMAIVLASLKPAGQMVSISPRSFTNGLYFKGFRKYLLDHSSLDLVHIFKHRNKLFKDEFSSVLQENVICLFTKEKQNPEIRLRTSECSSTLENLNENSLESKLLIDCSNQHKMIRLPESNQQLKALRIAEKLSYSFEDVGYFISTGPVVEHRTREFINKKLTTDSIPLYRPHNIEFMRVHWSGKHKKDVCFRLLEGYDKHTLINSNYVLLKRFTSKDEKRRLVAGVYVKDHHNTNLIGFGNKTNYIGVKGDSLSLEEAYGISAIFNSSFMESYFRSISGNTQVNATEIRVMKFPTRNEVLKLGRQLKDAPIPNQDELDRTVNKVLRLSNN